MAETVAVAWRRLDRLPGPDAALPWLLSIARRVAANQRRSVGRRVRLGLLLRAQTPAPALHPKGSGAAAEALERLAYDDQELLRLLAWEGLSQAEAGVVLGISANAVAIRLYRARRRFAHELATAGMKGSGSGRTSDKVEARSVGRRTRQEDAE